MSNHDEQQASATQLAPENAPSFADLATPEEGTGAWPEGWYRATIIQGYTTGRGKVFETKDVSADKAGSRNLFICLTVKGDVFVPSDSNPAKRVLTQGPGGTRNMRATLNYRPETLTQQFHDSLVERLTDPATKKLRAINTLPDKSLQAAALSIGRIGQLEKAVGFKAEFDGARINAGVYVSHQVDVRLKIGEKGFNDVAAFAASGSHFK